MTQETIEKIKDLTYKIKALESLATFDTVVKWVDQKKFCAFRVNTTQILTEPSIHDEKLDRLAKELNACIIQKTASLIEEYRAKLAKLILL